MHPQKVNLFWMNLIGGMTILASYGHGLVTHPSRRMDLWGGIPDGLQHFYGISMLSAAIGYFAFTYYFFRLDAENTRFLGNFRYGWLSVLYALVLVPSALWMPLTFAMMVVPNLGLWIVIRALLVIVGAASLGLLIAALTARPRRPGPSYTFAILGLAAFCIQTSLLDALVWPLFFSW